MVQVPGVSSSTVAPATKHVAGVAVVNVTVKPDDALAVRTVTCFDTDAPAGWANVIVWASGSTCSAGAQPVSMRAVETAAMQASPRVDETSVVFVTVAVCSPYVPAALAVTLKLSAQAMSPAPGPAPATVAVVAAWMAVRLPPQVFVCGPLATVSPGGSVSRKPAPVTADVVF